MKSQVVGGALAILTGAILAHSAGAHPQAATAAQGVKAKATTQESGGQPMILGKWQMSGAAGQAGYTLEKGFIEEHAKILGVPSVNKSVIVDPPDGKVPYQPWALALRNEREKISNDWAHMKSRDLDTNVKCYPSGIPHLMYRDGPLIVRFPNYVLMEFEFGHQYRVIYTDGRPHLPSNVKLWFGDARGHWEGNTLVVDTTNLNGYAWLDVIGDFYSDDAHILERFTPVDGNTMNYDATITDPHVFTKPWTMRLTYTRPKSPPGENDEIWEHACNEGNHAPVWERIYRTEVSRRK